ncbi:MAG: hypothetical protein OXI01_22495 [Albidovulum sp.]|nr:hypothetical protein [Albidovulum sp.]
MKEIYLFVTGAITGIVLAYAALYLARNSASGLGAAARIELVPKPAPIVEKEFPSDGFEAYEGLSSADASDSPIARISESVPRPTPKPQPFFSNAFADPVYIGKEAKPETRGAEKPPEQIIDKGFSGFGNLSIGRERKIEPSGTKSAREIAMSVDSLSVLASMSVDKIDSLTRLMASLRSGEAVEPVRPAPVFRHSDARSSAEPRLSTFPFLNEAIESQAKEWTVRGDGRGTAYLAKNGDASESFPVQPGMVIGELGPIGQIEWFDTEIGVVFENGHEIVGKRDIEEDAGD